MASSSAGHISIRVCLRCCEWLSGAGQGSVQPHCCSWSPHLGLPSGATLKERLLLQVPAAALMLALVRSSELLLWRGRVQAPMLWRVQSQAQRIWGSALSAHLSSRVHWLAGQARPQRAGAPALEQVPGGISAADSWASAAGRCCSHPLVIQPAEGREAVQQRSAVRQLRVEQLAMQTLERGVAAR